MAVKNLYQIDQTYDPRATLKNQGVAGVLGENIGRAAVGAYKGVKKATKAQYDAERMLLSGAMEGTGKLLFGQNNKPTFGMSDDMPAALPMPTIGNQAQASQVAQQSNWQGNWSPNPEMSRVARPSAIKPYLGTPTATTTNQAGQGAKEAMIQGKAGKPSNVTMTGLPMDIGINGASKTVTKDGKTIYSDAPAIGMMQRPQASGMKSVGGTTPQERYAMQQAEFAGQDMQSQLAREEAAAAENKRQNLAMFAPQVGMNPMLQDQLQRSMDDYNRAMGSGNVADRSMAKHAKGMIDEILKTQGQVTDQQLKSSGMGQEGNQFYAKLGEDARQANQKSTLESQKLAMQSPYYQSLATENNAQAQAALLYPKLGKSAENKEWEVEKETAADGSTQLVRVNKLTGIKEPFKLTPEQKAQQSALGNYKLAMDKLNMLDKESPLYAQRLNALDNDPEVKQLRALGLI